MIGETITHHAAAMQGLLKVYAGVDISYTLTSRLATLDDGDDEFTELHIVKWSFLIIPTYNHHDNKLDCNCSGSKEDNVHHILQWSKLVGGVLFNLWVFCHLYQFAKGLIGRRWRVPTFIFYCLGCSPSLFLCFGCTSAAPPPYMKFQFLEGHLYTSLEPQRY